MKKSKEPQKLLTDVELEFMSIIWKRGEATVNDVIEGSDRKLAYTSVSTILRILEQKGILGTRKEGRGHVYIPQVTKAEYEARTLQHVVNKVFDGTPVALVRQLLGSVKIKPEELSELKDLVARLEKSK